MNKNKGFIGIGLILAIVLGIAVVGGGAYYLGKSKEENKEVKIEENSLPNNENQNTPVVNNTQTDCNKNSPSTLKLISPNGGEVYKAGDKIMVRWESCNVDSGTTAIFLMKRDSSLPYDQRTGVDDHSIFNFNVIDSGKVLSGNRTQEITIPKSLNSALPYYIFINGNGDTTNIGSGYGPQDFSDDLFTINSTETTQIKVYFAKKSFSGCAIDIKSSDLDYFYRTIPKTQAVARASIEELLKGPTQEENSKGYKTDIPDGTYLKSITITNGEALVDFNGTIENGVTSCGGGMRIWQIRQTLLQFPTIKTVKFSVDGKTEDIFQA